VTARQKLAAFRADHINVLGQTDFSARLAAARSSFQDANLELQGAKEASRSLKARLANTKPFIGRDDPPPQIVVGDQLIVTAIDRINTLRAQLQALRLRYTEDHPDVISARNELADLVRQYSSDEEKAVGIAVPSGSITAPHNPTQSQTTDRQADARPLSAALSVPPSRTEVAPRLSQPPATLSAALAAGTPAAATSTHSAAIPTTPNQQYADLKAMQLKAELAILEAEQKVARIGATLSSLEAEAKNAPPVEAELAELTREFETAKKNYEDLLPRRESARMSQAVDTTVDVVQFRVVDPPTVPAKASGPNRNIILFLGTLVSLAGGAFAAFARGTLASAVISARDLSNTYGLPVIATIGTPAGSFSRIRFSLQLISVIISALGIAVAMVAVAYLIPPLEHYRFKAYEVASQTLRF
jgi:capsule polysaccharide export protein KpsE/RkpR